MTDQDFDKLPKIVKLRALGALKYFDDKLMREKKIRDDFKSVEEIFWLSDDIQIVKKVVYAKERDRFDGREYVYGAYVDGKNINVIEYRIEAIIFEAFAKKYDGINSKFTEFALRMLQIDRLS
ncbi:MAG: hypothetical protein ACOCVF_02265 [bacterium]